MFKKCIKGCLFTLALFSAFANAIDITALNPVEPLKVKSKLFKEALEYNITLPQGYELEINKDKKYFVIFDLHPRSQPFLSGLHDWLSHNGGWPWPESIVVTPASYNAEFASLFEQLVENPKNHAILDYFESDLLKTIDAKYRTNGFKIYNGFVSNGAFGLYILLNRPELFNAYIISSPSLANDFGDITLDAPEKLTQLDDKLRFLYISIGDHQYERGNLASFDAFAQTLKEVAPKTLDWQVHHNTENNYMSGPIVSVVNGIEALFADMFTNLKPDSDISKKGAAAIIEYYSILSTKKYGFSVSAEGSLKALANSLMASDPKKALAIFHKTVELYSESAYAISALAKAYAELGDIQLAIDYQLKAVEKSKTMSTWNQNKHLQYLDEYKAKLNNN
ncbi:esterase [Colwelliaceae bacterium BS250]